MPKTETAVQRDGSDDELADVPSVDGSGMSVAIRPDHDLKTRAILLSLGIDVAEPSFHGRDALTAWLRSATLGVARSLNLGRETARSSQF
jgi:hypothetical protein